MTTSRRTFLRRSALLSGVAIGPGCLSSGPTPVEQLRDATDAFDTLDDVGVALEEGYRSAATHVVLDDGGLGEVFVDREQPLEISPDELDPERPQLLYFRLTEEGQYQGAGVGWSVPTATADGTPQLFDTDFSATTSIRDESDVYRLSAWPFRDNPDGPFAPTHPDLTGPSFVEGLETARLSLGRFVESGKAEEAGYLNSEKHVVSDDGIYGVAFDDPDAVGLDLERPGILLYRMTEQWYYQLLGVEWYVPADEADGPPTLLEQQFHDPMPGHSPETDQPEHYGLHAWLFQANPDGMFALYNPFYR